MTTRTVEITYDGVPRSLNAGGAGSRRHWSKGYREKREWEGIWAMLLLAEKLPRGASKVRVNALIEVEDNRRRDSENFRPAISKPLADALVKGGWLPDDTDEFFSFGTCKIRNGVALDQGMALQTLDRRGVHGRTTLTIEAEYEDEPSSSVSFDRTQVG